MQSRAMSNNVELKYPNEKLSKLADTVLDDGDKQLGIAVGSQIRTFRAQF